MRKMRKLVLYGVLKCQRLIARIVPLLTLDISSLPTSLLFHWAIYVSYILYGGHHLVFIYRLTLSPLHPPFVIYRSSFHLSVSSLFQHPFSSFYLFLQYTLTLNKTFFYSFGLLGRSGLMTQSSGCLSVVLI